MEYVGEIRCTVLVDGRGDLMGAALADGSGDPMCAADSLSVVPAPLSRFPIPSLGALISETVVFFGLIAFLFVSLVVVREAPVRIFDLIVQVAWDGHVEVGIHSVKIKW